MVQLYLEFDKTNVLKQGVLTPCKNKKTYVIEQIQQVFKRHIKVKDRKNKS